jgi:hypothetical protein
MGTVYPESANGRTNVADKAKHDELVSQLTSPGWRLIPTGIDPAVEGTLEDMARAAHARKRSGKHPGAVQRAEDSLELGAFDLEQLWWHMGLPM